MDLGARGYAHRDHADVCGLAICGLSVCAGYDKPIPAVFTKTPTLYGEASPGSELLIVTEGVTGGPQPSLAYQWQQDGRDIPGETGTAYAIPLGTPIGALISCLVTATNAAGSVSAESEALPVVGTAPYFVRKPKLGRFGDYLALSLAAGGNPIPSRAYRWIRNSKPLEGEDAPSLNIAKHGPGAYACIVELANPIVRLSMPTEIYDHKEGSK
jgi:hypothetical protein